MGLSMFEEFYDSVLELAIKLTGLLNKEPDDISEYIEKNDYGIKLFYTTPYKTEITINVYTICVRITGPWTQELKKLLPPLVREHQQERVLNTFKIRLSTVPLETIAHYILTDWNDPHLLGY